MGREIKRVPLDFKWPIDQLWKGYLNPYTSQECKACDRTGYNDATRKLNEDWYSFENTNYVYLPNGRRYNDNAWQYHLTQIEVDALVKEGRLMDLTHNWEPEIGWSKKEPAYIPTADEVNNWAINAPFGHDSIYRWICVKARAEHQGVYGTCEFCGGEGEIWQSDEIKKLNELWESFDPPVGEGYKLWSTTTEGHPMTPVFSSAEELAEYCGLNKVSVFGSSTMTKEEWLDQFQSELITHQEGNVLFI